MTSDEYIQNVEKRIEDILTTKAAEAPTPEAKQMNERISTLVLRAGKRSRPKLLELTYRGYGGTDTEMLVDIGVALELQHQFLLVHDDIMDNDTVRYDGLNILGMYRQDYDEAHWDIASSMALMAGDLLATYSQQAILDHPTLMAEQKLSLCSMLNQTNISVQAGQQLDVVNLASLHPDIDEQKLETTDYLKTAVYTVQQPMLMAAELLNLPADEREKIADFARAYGILYQMVDDYADYFETGTAFDDHPKYRDIRQGKITYPLLQMEKKLNKNEQIKIKQHLGNKNASEQMTLNLLSVLRDSQIQDATLKLMKSNYAAMLTKVDEINISIDLKAQLLQIFKGLF